jgi:hypothetical protein
VADKHCVEGRASRKPFTHAVYTKLGHFCSQHTSRALAEKAITRLVRMSNGKLTADYFEITQLPGTRA